jgi:NDP-sugar pyrophosphorylase family protein
MLKRLQSFRAVVLAGGRGSRLYPFTATLPKPLLPIGERTVIEIIIRRLALFGATRVTVAVNYLADLIEGYLADGRRIGVAVDYVRESLPLGTAGPLGLVDEWDEPIVAMNGDILCDLDFGALLAQHKATGAAMTIAAATQTQQIDSGVLITDGTRLTRIIEKPVTTHKISMGIYVLSPRVQELVAPNVRLEMPDLATSLLEAGECVMVYEHAGSWLDIGRPDDFAKAQADHAFAERLLSKSGKGAARKIKVVAS